VILRRFAELPFGQLHYRLAGPSTGAGGRTLVTLHASPGSSRQLVGLIDAHAARRRVIAPDTPGFGDSAALPIPAPAIIDYAAALLDFLDVAGVDEFDVYGSHTGACIATELAILAPGRVRRVLIDGVGVFTRGERDEYLAHYAHPFVPALDGSHLVRAFNFCRDQYLFFPWYRHTRAARRDAGLRPAEELHAWVLEVLKAAQTYHLGYRAAFAWDAPARLALVTQPTLAFAAEDDPLAEATRAVTPVIPAGRFEALPRYDDPAYGARRTALIETFLGTG
jgi:pimeloyl-ACP methyl ester carboxylesterase